MIEPGRKFVQGVKKYRYGFNGKENDNEVKGEGNQQDYGMRIYDPRLGKFLSVDPLRDNYPYYTPYSFAGNMPIWAIDLDGSEPLVNSNGTNWTAGSNFIDEVLAWWNSPATVSEKKALAYQVNYHSAGVDQNASAYDGFTKGQYWKMQIGLSSLAYSQSSPGNISNVTTKIKQPQTPEFENSINIRPAQSKSTSKEVEVKTNSQIGVVPVLDKIGRRKQYAEKTFTEAGKNPRDVLNLMKTVDFKKAVREKILDIGDKVYRFERINSKGGEMHFFTDAHGADAGPNGVGFASPEGYKLVTYEVTQKTKVMESTIRNTSNKQYFSTDLQKNIKKIGEE